MATMSPATGARPADQVLALDQEPLETLVIVAPVPKSGMLKCGVTTFAGTARSSSCSRLGLAHRCWRPPERRTPLKKLHRQTCFKKLPRSRRCAGRVNIDVPQDCQAGRWD